MSRRARLWQSARDAKYVPHDLSDVPDDDDEVHDLTCRECGGSGRDDWNDGILACEHCDGEGYQWWK